MNDEVDAFENSDTWNLTSLPKEKKEIGCTWMYEVKHNADGTISKYKACLIAKGYVQTYGMYFEETFNLVSKMETMRAVIAMAVAKIWELQQMDVENAFFNGICKKRCIWNNQRAMYI